MSELETVPSAGTATPLVTVAGGGRLIEQAAPGRLARTRVTSAVVGTLAFFSLTMIALVVSSDFLYCGLLKKKPIARL